MRYMFDYQIENRTLERMTTAQRIKLLLDEQGKTQKWLAITVLGMSENGLKKMFNRDSYKNSTLEKIAKAFNVSISELLGDKSNKSVSRETPNQTHLERENQLLRDLLKAKEEIIEILKATKREPEVQPPLEIKDLIDRNTMKKVERFLGDDIYNASVCVSDKFGNIEYVNAQFTKQTGYTIADIQGKKPKELLQRGDADKATLAKMREAILKRTYFEGEVVNYSKKGEKIMCKLIISPITINGIEKLISLAVFSKVNVLKYN